jgi:hypothetical protein
MDPDTQAAALPRPPEPRPVSEADAAHVVSCSLPMHKCAECSFINAKSCGFGWLARGVGGFGCSACFFAKVGQGVSICSTLAPRIE